MLLFVNSSTPCWPAGQASHFALIFNYFQCLNLFSESPKLLILPHPFLPSHYTVTSGPGVHNALPNYNNHLSAGSLPQYFILCLELNYSSLLWASSFSSCLSKNTSCPSLFLPCQYQCYPLGFSARITIPDKLIEKSVFSPFYRFFFLQLSPQRHLWSEWSLLPMSPTHPGMSYLFFKSIITSLGPAPQTCPDY